MTFSQRLTRFQELMSNLAARPATGEEDPRLVELAEIDGQAAADLVVARRDAELRGDALAIALLDVVDAARERGLGAIAVYLATQAVAYHRSGSSEKNFVVYWAGQVYHGGGLAAVGDFDHAVGELRSAGVWPWGA